MPRGAPAARLVADLPEAGWEAVGSSNLEAVLYKPADQILLIRFKSSAVYIYSEVPRRVYDGLMNAGSKGKFHHNSIKGQFPFVGPLAG